MNRPGWTSQKFQFLATHSETCQAFMNFTSMQSCPIPRLAPRHAPPRYYTLHTTDHLPSPHHLLDTTTPYLLVHFTRWYTFAPRHVPCLSLPIIPYSFHLRRRLKKKKQRLLLAFPVFNSCECVPRKKESHVEVRAIISTTNFTQGSTEVYDCRDNRCSTVGVVRVDSDRNSYSLDRGYTNSGAV